VQRDEAFHGPIGRLNPGVPIERFYLTAKGSRLQDIEVDVKRPQGENMARPPNYNQERKERDQKKAAKKAEKALLKAAKSGRTPKEEETAAKEPKAE
jgi:hypothetical protein